jgi:glucokinase
MLPLLLADIGGTNARFAFHDGALGQPSSLSLDQFAGIAPLLAHVLAGRRVRGMVLAVAGPVAGNAVTMTNRDWRVDGAALGAHLLNDFEALAWALPALTPADVMPFGGGSALPGAPVAVLGPGTGLGVGAWLPPDRVLASQGGNARLAAEDADDAALLATLRERLSFVSAEEVLSGRGLVALHRALTGETLTAAEVTARAPATVARFCALLGGFAGDVALMFNARGGVFLGGGILPRFPAALVASAFRARFEAKGSYAPYLAAIPTALITHPYAALLGAARYAERLAL